MSRKRIACRVVVSHGHRISKYKLGSNTNIKPGIFKQVEDSKYIGKQMNLMEVLEEERVKAAKRFAMGDVIPYDLGNVGVMRTVNAIMTSWSYIEGDEVIVHEQKFGVK